MTTIYGNNSLGRCIKLIVSALIVMLAMAIAPLSASAHAHLESSTPASGATVAPGLTEIRLVFSEEVSVDQSTVELMRDGTAVSGASGAVNRAARNEMTITTPGLEAGTYEVRWKAVTEDDNGITNGTFNFTVQAASTGTGTGTTTTTGTGTQTGSTSLPAAGNATDLAPALLLAALLTCMAGVGFRLRARTY